MPDVVSASSASKRIWLVSAVTAVMLAGPTSPSEAQVVIPERPIIWAPPWNALHVFDPTLLPLLSDPTTREPVAPEDTPVKGRQWPEYQPPGIRAGTWMFDPSVSAGGLYDSNVFSSNTEKQSDLAATLGASLHARTLWERHGIDLRASTLSTIYREHAGLNQTDASLNGQAHFDIDHATTLLSGFQAAYLHAPVGSLISPAGAVEPTPFSLLSGDLTLRHEFGRLTGSAGASVDSYDFGSTVAQNGRPISKDSSDGQIYQAHGRIDYAFSEKLSLFTAASGNTRRLRGVPGLSFNSDGYRALAGFDVELTPLVKAELAGGYMDQRFEAASFGTLKGPTYRAMLTWSPSRQLDVYFNAEQLVTTPGDISVTAIVANAAQLGFDYEIRRNVTLSAAATYEKDNFKTEVRNDTVYGVDVQLIYRLTNMSSISLRYNHIRRDSSQPQFDFDKDLIGIKATAQF